MHDPVTGRNKRERFCFLLEPIQNDLQGLCMVSGFHRVFCAVVNTLSGSISVGDCKSRLRRAQNCTPVPEL